MTLNIRIVALVGKNLFFDIAGLPDPFTVSIPVCISNNEDIVLYFRLTIVNPPPGWQTVTADLGPVAAGYSKCFIANLTRSRPTLTAGKYTETITVRVEAYTDSTYTTLYNTAEDQLTITYIDHTDPAWTILYQDNFDDATLQGWLSTTITLDNQCPNGSGPVTSTLHYISAPYSLNLRSGNIGHVYKSYDVGPGYTEAYAIIHIYSADDPASPYPPGLFAIKVNDTYLKRCHMPAPNNAWLRYVAPLNVNATNTVRVSCRFQDAFLDDIIVIAQ